MEEFLFKTDDGDMVNVSSAFIVVAGVCDDDELGVVDVKFNLRDDGVRDGNDDGDEEFLPEADNGEMVNVSSALIVVAGVGDDDKLGVVDVEFKLRDDGVRDGNDDGVEELLAKMGEGM